jgi:PAS domain S-box-containing protein
VNILLVDDRPENLLALEAILEPLNEHLVRATSGDEALRHLLVRDFAAILLDVQMPGLNGFETAQLIKARERSRHIPIIFLTAINKDDEHAFRGYEVGAVDYMSKPFQPDVLRSKVAVFVDLYRKQEQLKRQEQLLRESERRQLQLQHRAELLESEARLAQIVGSALDAIVTVEGDGRVSLFNAAAEHMFGLPASAVLGRPVAGLFAEPLSLDELERVARGAAVDGAAARPGGAAGYTGHRADGERFPAEATVSRLELNGAVTYTLIVRDVSEQRRAAEALRTQAASLAATTAKLTALNAELQRRQAELQHAMTARNRFYASMSHELRTPINAIIGYSTLLIDHIYGPLNDRQQQGLVRSHLAAKHLLELVNDVLDLSKIEAGKIELALQPVSFPSLVEDLFVTVRPLADEHRSTLSLHGDCKATIVTDPRRVRQIMLNLLSNAIKFGSGQPIEVHCAARPEGGVVVGVRDHGPGIRPADLPRIFDEFVQLPNANPAVQGTGLGLPISQRLARLLGGELLVESTPGEGSTFRLVLPASCDEAGRGARAVEPADDDGDAAASDADASVPSPQAGAA